MGLKSKKNNLNRLWKGSEVIPMAFKYHILHQHWSPIVVGAQINTTEETFQSDIIDSTIFQTNSFDVLSEFALLVSSTTCSAYSSVLSNESEKMFQQNFQNNLFHLNKFDNDSEFFGQRNCCSADCVAGPAWRDRVHKYCVTILYIGSHQSRP